MIQQLLMNNVETGTEHNVFVIQVTAYAGNDVNKEIMILVNLAGKVIFLKTTWDLFKEKKIWFSLSLKQFTWACYHLFKLFISLNY